MWTMTEAGRHLHRPPCPHCSIQGHLEPAAQFSVQTSFDPLQDGDPVTSLGNQCQCLVTLHKEGHPVILKDEVATIKLCSCKGSDWDIRPFKHSEITHATLTRAIIILQFQPIGKYIDMFIHSHFLKFSIFCSAFFYPRKTFPYSTFGTLHHFPHMLEDILGTSLILICRSSSSAAVKGAGEDCDIKYFLYPFSETSS